MLADHRSIRTFDGAPLVNYACQLNMNLPAMCVAGVSACPMLIPSVDKCAAVCDGLRGCTSFVYNRYHECYIRSDPLLITMEPKPDHPHHMTNLCKKTGAGPTTMLWRTWSFLAPWFSFPKRRCTQCVHDGSHAPTRLLMVVTTESSAASRQRLYTK